MYFIVPYRLALARVCLKLFSSSMGSNFYYCIAYITSCRAKLFLMLFLYTLGDYWCIQLNIMHKISLSVT